MAAINQAKLRTFLLLLSINFVFRLAESRPMATVEIHEEPYLTELKILRLFLESNVIPTINKLYGRSNENLNAMLFKIKKLKSMNRNLDNAISESEVLRIILRLSRKFLCEIQNIKDYKFDFNVDFSLENQILRKEALTEVTQILKNLIQELEDYLDDIWVIPNLSDTSRQKIKLLKILPDNFGNVMDIDFYFIDFLYKFLNIAIERVEKL